MYRIQLLAYSTYPKINNIDKIKKNIKKRYKKFSFRKNIDVRRRI